MRRTVACMALAILTTAPYQAESKLEPPPLDRYLRWGPLRVRPGLVLSNMGYDDNILLRGDERQVSDYTATLSPRLDGLLLFGHSAFLTFREQIDYTAYLDNSDQSFANNRAKGRLTVPLRGFGVFADVELNRIRERPVDLDDIRPRRSERGAGFGVILQPGWRTEIEIGRAFEKLRYEDPDFDLMGPSIGERLDRSERTTSVDVAYRALGRTRVLLAGLFRTIDFREPVVVDGEPIARDTRETRLLAGLDFGEEGPLNGSFVLGWGEVGAEDPLLADLSELIGEAELLYRLNSRTRFELEGRRLPGFAVSGPNSYYLDSRVGLRTVYFFSRFIGVEAGSTVGRLTFPDSTNVTGRTDRLTRHELGIRFRLMQNSLGRRVEYSLRVGRYKRDSTLDSLDRTQTTFGLGAVLGF